LSLERLEVTPLSTIVGEILQEKRTGHLTIVAHSKRKILYWSQGELVLVTSASPEDSLADFLVRRGIVPQEKAAALVPSDPVDAVARFQEGVSLDPSTRQALLREWITSLTIPLFSLDEGTTAFVLDSAIDPDKRVFLQSTSGIVLDGIRAISNGLVLRRALGDLKREIIVSREAQGRLDTVPLTDGERKIASSLTSVQSIESFLKHFMTDSVTAAKTIIAMLTLGIFVVAEGPKQSVIAESGEDVERDLALLASIGAKDKRSLRAVGLFKQLASVDYYELIGAPRNAAHHQIIACGEEAKKRYDPTTYPPAVKEAVTAISRQVDQAIHVLRDATRRLEYDRMVSGGGSAGDLVDVQMRATQRSIAEKNLSRAQELSFEGDYYGAIVLLKQAVEFAPNMTEAWFLLGSCQERNPKWRRDASASLMKVLALNPNHVLAMVALGDIYIAQGLASRAQSYYEDALQIEPENTHVKKKLKELKR